MRKNAPKMSGFSEVAAVGPRKVSARPSLKHHLLTGAGLVAMSAVAVLGTTSITDTNPVFNTATQHTTAQVVGKVWHLGAPNLESGSWQPLDDLGRAQRQLVLTVPGEDKPVVVAVSPKMFNAYCRHLGQSTDFPSSIIRGGEGFAGCDTVHNPEAPTPPNLSIDEVEVTYTRSKIDGSIKLMSLAGETKAAPSFSELYALRKEQKRDLTSRPMSTSLSPRG